MSRARTTAALLIVFFAGAAGPADARQGGAARRLTTLDALRQFPSYFHLQDVLLRGEFAESDLLITFRAADSEMRVVLDEGVAASSGPVEIRATMIDVGRLDPGDPRVAPFAGGRDVERWPKPGEELILSVSGVTSVQPATTPSLRALALEPWRFEGEQVTVVGQFRGRNLFADLPAAPARGPDDFVVRAADGAIWVTGLEPRTDDFELSVDARVDTAEWVEVTGTVARERGLVLIEGTAFDKASEPETAAEAAPPVALPVPLTPVEVVFSAPTADEIGVAPATSIRVQFSRGLDPDTIQDQIRVSYLGAEADAAPLEFQQTYDAANRAIAITFAQPLEAFRTVRVELGDGLRGFDGAPFAPWTLTFSTGG